MTVLFGFAINNDVRGLTAAVVDSANTAASRALVADARATQVIDELIPANSPWEMERLLRQGKVSLGIYIPPDLEERIAQGRRPLAQILVDDSDPTILGTARGLVNLPLQTFDQMQARGTFEFRALYNPERRSAVFIVPGLCGVILSLTMVLFTSTAIVRERERVTWSCYYDPGESAGTHGWQNSALHPDRLRSDQPDTGSWRCAFRCAHSRVADRFLCRRGFLCCQHPHARADDLDRCRDPVPGDANDLHDLPAAMLLSGFMFPFDGMPRMVQWFAEILPLTHFLRIVRGIVLKQAALPSLGADIWPLALFFMVMMTFATLRFNKKLD